MRYLMFTSSRGLASPYPAYPLSCCLLLAILLASAVARAQADFVFHKMDAAHARSYQELSNLSLPDRTIILEAPTNTKEFASDERQSVLSVSVPIDVYDAVTLKLHRQDIFAPGAHLVTSGGEAPVLLANTGQHYYGKVEGQQRSTAAVSVFDDQMVATFSYQGVNYNLERLAPGWQRRTAYALYPEPDQMSDSFHCATDDDNTILEMPEGMQAVGKKSTARSAAGDIEIYLECDYKTYTDKGSGTANYATGLFNVVKGIYSDAGVTMVISQLKIWNTPDPYGATSGNSSSAVLNAFEDEVCVYDGHIAHLLSTSTYNLGGIANRPSCSNGTYSGSIHGFSNIHTSYSSNLNVYSWSVNVLAHELGHNMSSPHTHACSWNGNDTQIDDCGNVYAGGAGSCYNSSSPIIPSEGTIMSYCHLNNSVGIDLSIGFHTQVATKIFEFAGCLTNGGGGCATPLPSDLTVTTTASSATISCGITSGISYYYWGYREAGTSSYTYSPSATSASSYQFTGLASGDYEATAVLYCGSSGWGGFSCPKPFTVGSSSGDCPPSLTLSEVPIPSGTYNAANSIQANGKVMHNGQVTMHSGNNVNLDSGFEVSAGGIVSIDIDGCP